MDKEADRIIELRQAGNSYREIQKKLDVSLDKVRYWCRKATLTGLNEASNVKENTVSDEANAKIKDVIKRIADRYPDFDLVSEYKNAHEPVTLRCKRCGCEHERKFEKWTELPKELCPECRKVASIRKKQLAKLRAEEQREERKNQREEQKHVDSMIKSLNKLEWKDCEYCGRKYLTAIKTSKTCSDLCRRKRANRIKENKKEFKGINIVDKSITLKKLAVRDDNTCYLCGELVDWNDCKVIDGNFVVGRKYPSIEHIIPRSKGGNHTWDNVKLAHMICNSVKNDKYPR